MNDIIVNCSTCDQQMRQVEMILAKGYTITRTDGLICKGVAPHMCKPCIERAINTLPSWMTKTPHMDQVALVH